MKKITQSFIKSFREYLAGEGCGNLIKHQWVDGKLLPPGKAMKLGAYFEFRVSGALPKDGKEPEPEMMKSGKDMIAAFRKAVNDAEYVKSLLKEMKIKIVSFGKKLTKGKHEGTLDLICEAEEDITIYSFINVFIKKGERFVIDLKYSGLLEDKWNKMGWVFTPEQKAHHKVQAIQYHYVSGGLKFIYMVVCPASSERDDAGEISKPNIGFFYIPVSGFMLEQQLVEANVLEEQFNFQKDVGFEPRPSFKKCQGCELFDSCGDKRTLPEIVLIDIGADD